jgi:hypothetical protein
MSDQVQDKPRFDYSNYSRKEQKAIQMLQMRLQRLGAKLDDAASLDDATFDALMAQFDAMVYDIERRALAQVVYVPRDWLVGDAPEGLTCQDDHWWDWLRADKLEELKEAAAEARQPESVSGN